MRQGVGSVVLYNIIIIFIVITFCFLSVTLSYVKAYKVNSKIANVLEKYEGYNDLSNKEMAQSLTTIGYRTGAASCSTRLHWSSHHGRLSTYSPISGTNHQYCLYEYEKYNGYFTYGIVTYIFFDIPIVGGTFKIPVYSETESIYEFSV